MKLFDGRAAVRGDQTGREAAARVLLAPTEPQTMIASNVALSWVGPVASRYRRIARLMALSDGSAVLSAFVVAYLLRFGTQQVAGGYTALTLLAPLVWIGVFHLHRLYAPEHLSAWEEFRRIITSSALGVIFLVMASYWTKAELSRLWLGYGWILALALLLVSRRAWRWFIAVRRADGRLAYRTLIVGLNEEAGRLADRLRPEAGFSPVGCVYIDRWMPSLRDLPVLGRLDQLGELVRDNQIECLFVASSATDTGTMNRIIQLGRLANVEIRLSANLPEILTSRLTVQPYGDVMALSLRPVRLTGSQTTIKRVFDLVVALLGLVVLSPVFLIVALVVRATSRGPVLFRQDRVTKGGRVFQMLKFRTMRSNADDLVAELDVDPSAPFFKLENDPRLTKVGNILRRFSLDEFPQLLNVIKGEMSLVGPRPLPVDQVTANLEVLTPRHEVPAGVTGWWQVQGRSSFTAQEAIRMDLFYIENWSLTLDLFILLKTVGVVAARKGAF